MLVRSCWLLSLLFTLSATAHAYRRPGALKPRYLATGTGLSPPSTSSPPYPTGTGNTTAPPTTSTSTPPPPAQTSYPFYLRTTNTTAALSNQYLYVGSETNGDGLLVLYLSPNPSPVASFSTFTLGPSGELINFFEDTPASIFGDYPLTELKFSPEADDVLSVCAIGAGGALTCVTGPNTVFYVCPFVVISGTLTGGSVYVGESVAEGCTGFDLVAVPV